MTAGGKNVAPALLEDRLRAHPLISQAMAVGDEQPFIAALITIDPEAFPGWKERNGKDAAASVGDLADDPDLIAEIDLAVKDANQAVSKAEAIRKFRILPVDFTEDTGELTPTLKVKRKVVAEKFAADIDALYADGLSSSARRRAWVLPLPVVDHPAPPRRAHPCGPVGVGEQVTDRGGDGADVPAVDHQPGLAVEHRLRRPARATGDHRHPGRGRLQVDDAQPFDIQSGAAGTARHREHVGHRVVGGQFVAGHAAGEHHVFGDPETVREALQRRRGTGHRRR